MGTVPVNFKGKKGRSGRPSKAKEFLKFYEGVKAETLIEMANKMIAHQLTLNPENPAYAKDFALPITLRGMTEKVKVTGQLDIKKVLDSLE